MTLDALSNLMAQSTAGYFAVLMSISWTFDGSTELMHITNNTQDIVHDGTTYKAFDFEYTPPTVTESSVGNAQITIQSVTQEIPKKTLDSLVAPKLVIQAVFVFETGLCETLAGWVFTLSSTQWNSTTLTAEITFETALDRYMPKDTFNVTDFPGCW